MMFIAPLVPHYRAYGRAVPVHGMLKSGPETLGHFPGTANPVAQNADKMSALRAAKYNVMVPEETF